MSTGPILKTKYFIPPFREEFLSRPRLIEQINAGIRQRLVVITAPAGYGKSTVMAEWTTQTKLPTAWLSLEKTDDDPFTFLRYLISSLQTQFSDLGANIFNALDSPNPPSAPPLTISLLNEISTQAQEFALVLDDFHSIRNPEVLSLLSTLIYNQPPQLHLIIASRSELPFSFSRIRGRGEMIHLGIDELRFNSQESAAYLHSRLGGRITETEARILEDNTEGWITGLQLAVLSFQPNQDIRRQIEAFSGQDRFIADYLIDEVLSNQPPEVQQFLLKTSILDKLHADLCEQVTGGANGQSILEYLDRCGLFVIPLDNTRTWYRYHHLFAELLSHRLLFQQNTEVIRLHHLAADWFFAHHMIEEAIEHLLRAEDYGQVTEYLEGLIDELLAKGKFSTYLSWLDRIPAQYLMKYPKLVLYWVFQLWEMGSLEKYHRQIRFVESLLGPLPDDLTVLDAQKATHHGILAVIKGVGRCGSYDTQEAAAYFQQALRLLPEEAIFWRTLSIGATGFCHRVEGNYSEASKCFSQVMSLATESDLLLLYFMYSIAQVLVYLASARLRDAINTCLLPLALDEKHGRSIPFSGLAYAVMGELYYQTGDLAAAEAHTRHGMELVSRDGDVYSTADAYYTLARIFIAQGNAGGALDLMDQMMKSITHLNPPESALIVAQAYQANVWITCNQLTPAKQWMANPRDKLLGDNQFPDIASLSYFGVYCTVHESFNRYIGFIHLTRARYEIVTGNPRKAIHILETLLESIVQKDRIFIRLQIFVLKAAALRKANEMDQAVVTLMNAIKLTAMEPFYQLFLEEKELLQDVLEKAKDEILRRVEKSEGDIRTLAFIEHVLSRIPAGQTLPRSADSETLFDLTPREIEVLQWLANGVSYAETANHLMVSSNTIKTHLKHIYSKLEVSNRLQAVNKAKSLGLLN